MKQKLGFIWWLRYLHASLAYHRATAICDFLTALRKYTGLPDNNTTSISESKAMEIKLQIREKRMEKGITQSELAGLLGVTQGAVMKWETGRCLPALDTAFHIAEALGCRIDDLIKKSPRGGAGENQ